MKQRFAEILDQLPEAKSRSRLEPYKELIRGLRQRQRSYREITRVLAEHCGVRVCHSTLHEFVERHLGDEATARANYSTPRLAEKMTSQPEDHDAAMRSEARERIAALKRKPSITPNQPAGFHFDGSEPLQLKPGKR